MLTTDETDETDEHGSNPSVAFNPRQSVVSVSSVVNPFSFPLLFSVFSVFSVVYFSGSLLVATILRK